MRRGIVCAACAIVIVAGWAQKSPTTALWYTGPAQKWEETLPVGNGRLGMMPGGNPWHERIVLNEISMWSGSKANYDNPKAAESLPEIQALLLEGRNREAQELMYTNFVPTSDTDYRTYGTYQLLGNLDVAFSYPIADAEPQQYVRWLDLTTAVAATEYTIGDIAYTQECIVPRGSDVMLYHVAADSPGAISFTATLSRPERAELKKVKGDCIVMSGNLDSGRDGQPGMGYAAAARIIACGLGAKAEASSDSTLTVANADDVWIAIGAATNYLAGQLYYTAALNAVCGVSVDEIAEIIAAGKKKYQELFDRVTINLPEGGIAHLPTDERLLRFQAESDPSLAALYYNYGRYLLISSTLPGCLPPNLQGLWANDVYTPWNGDYHTNINVQMNHWLVEPGNLAELHGPLIDLVKRSVPAGEHTAKVFYGPNAKGWVMHMMTNPWEFTDPGQHPSWGATNTGGAWLCEHLWQHYVFNPDEAYLADIYPILKGASEFFLSTMITEPKHGWLVTAPTSSPENTFYIGDDRTKIAVCMGPTMDAQIVRELFTNTLEAATILGEDEEFCGGLSQALALLPPNRIGSDGRLMEWLEEYEEAEPQHRHVSHLYGLHPSNQISPTLTPELADACRATLNARGDEATGWSRAWKMNFWARLGDGNRAYKLFKSLLQPAYTTEKPKHGSGTFPNLFCSHPPFQMDGNWGGTAGIGEMLVQSHEGFVNILPALPDEWASGSISGVRLPGGAEITLLEWADGKPTRLDIKNASDTLKIKVPDGTESIIINGETLACASPGVVTMHPHRTTD